MKKLFVLTAIILFSVFGSYTYAENNQASEPYQIKLMKKLKSMYEHKHFSSDIFDIKNGYLQTAVASNDDRMPLQFFIDYNNMWWFNIIKSVDVPSVGYNPKTQTGFIILNINYGGKHTLRGMQYVKFKDRKIYYIRTYASPDFWNNKAPSIQLDRYGNEIWLTTGYSLNYSVKAAKLFFSSPKGKLFSKNSYTSTSVKKIKSDLKNYLKHNQS